VAWIAPAIVPPTASAATTTTRRMGSSHHPVSATIQASGAERLRMAIMTAFTAISFLP
jgi:hypothetical protein